MEVVRTYTCPCRPGFTYASSSALHQHKKTQRHRVWEERTRCEKIDATKKDNELFTLRLKLSDREETIEKLDSRIIELTLKNKKLSEDNKLLKRGLKRFIEPEDENPVIANPESDLSGPPAPVEASPHAKSWLSLASRVFSTSV